ncbi:response regulator [Bradyrhizobium sp. CCBAU 53421]|uniref:response regulator n=1 Tax=Bradyrhizobium sp. CCBAU 53421 TaxID=1325120 RepID=UPI001FEFD226|nr:response regulator [Bradyrhizobium sp. CCBAU 53421]
MHTILIVEDEYFIADDCAALARQAGYHVVGPFASVDEARPHASGACGALIDINVNGTASYKLVDALLEMGIPVTLYTGYDASNLPEKYAHVPLVTKPRGCAEALGILRKQMGAIGWDRSAAAQGQSCSDGGAVQGCPDPPADP